MQAAEVLRDERRVHILIFTLSKAFHIPHDLRFTLTQYPTTQSSGPYEPCAPRKRKIVADIVEEAGPVSDNHTNTSKRPRTPTDDRRVTARSASTGDDGDAYNEAMAGVTARCTRALKVCNCVPALLYQ